MHNHRSDVVGSLLRPDYLKAARQRREKGTIGPAEFKRIEDRAVIEAVALQTSLGLDVLTDGEMRRFAFYGHFVDAVEGYDKLGGWAIPFRDEDGRELVLQRPVVVEKLKRIRPMCTEEFSYLRARTDKPVKVTLINAQQAAAYYDADKSKAAYPTSDAYLADVVDILRASSWAAPTSRSMLPSTPVSSIPPFAKATASEAWIPTRCSIGASSSTTPWRAATRA
jgi:5-methyltetrahydropteroyltriglutamate--homocysteine methyltransferase